MLRILNFILLTHTRLVIVCLVQSNTYTKSLMKLLQAHGKFFYNDRASKEVIEMFAGSWMII
jgi:hypothetical protein